MRENGDMTSGAVRTAIKEKWPRHTPTMSVLSNVLSKNPKDFMIMESVKQQDVGGNGTYDVYVWGLIE